MARNAVIPDHAFEVASAIRVRHVQTPISRVLRVNHADTVVDAAAQLAQRGFDEAPVDRDGSIVGMFHRPGQVDDRRVCDVMEPLQVGSFVGAEASIGSLLQWLTERPSYLVLDGRAISGLVTVSDLNKQPVRTHFYLLIATVEMGLADAIRRAYQRQDRFLELLSSSRADKVLAKYDEDRAADLDSDLVAVLDFADVMTVARRTPSIDTRIAEGARVRLKTIGGKAARIRNNVMHPTRPGLLAADLTVHHVATTERGLQAIADVITVLPKRLAPYRPPRPKPIGPTPTELAAQLGVSPSKVRAYLRVRHARTPSLKGFRWGPLDHDIARDVEAVLRRTLEIQRQ